MRNARSQPRLQWKQADPWFIPRPFRRTRATPWTCPAGWLSITACTAPRAGHVGSIPDTNRRLPPDELRGKQRAANAVGRSLTLARREPPACLHGRGRSNTGTRSPTPIDCQRLRLAAGGPRRLNGQASASAAMDSAGLGTGWMPASPAARRIPDRLRAPAQYRQSPDRKAPASVADMPRRTGLAVPDRRADGRHADQWSVSLGKPAD